MIMPSRYARSFAGKIRNIGKQKVRLEGGEMLPFTRSVSIGIDCVKSSKPDKQQPETFPFFGQKSLRLHFLLCSRT